MIELTLTLVQSNWLEVSWTEVTQEPDIITPNQPEAITPGQITRTELKHVSYHPTQIALLKADANAIGTSLIAHAALLDKWVADYVPEPAPAPVVPAVVSMRQARLALLQVGKLSVVNAAINALPSPQKEAAQIEWEYSQEVQRHNGLVSQLAPILDMSNQDLDGLFILANSF